MDSLAVLEREFATLRDKYGLSTSVLALTMLTHLLEFMTKGYRSLTVN